MLMQMMSAGAMGGRHIVVDCPRARRRTPRRRRALVLHAMVIAVAFGSAFTVALLSGGRWLLASWAAAARAYAALHIRTWCFAALSGCGLQLACQCHPRHPAIWPCRRS